MTATSPPPPVGPGWYPDPWYPGVVRWFDGSQWTEHAAPMGGPGAGQADVYDGAKGESTTRLVGYAFIGRGIALGIQGVVSAVIFGDAWRHLRDFFNDPESAQSTTFGNSAPFGGSSTALTLLSQLMSLVGVLALIALCVWTYRATKNARALGLRTGISPGWAVGGWIIPLASWVMPFIAVRDLFPDGDPGRRRAAIWWACEIIGVVLSFATMVAAIAFGTGAASAVGAVSAGFFVAAGILGYGVSRAATAVHASIAAGHRQG